MSKKLIPRSSWSFPALRFPFSLFEENDDDWIQDFSDLSGLSVSEDDKHVYIEAALPGIAVDEIEVTFDKGILWIKAEKKETESKTKKYYRKATSQFSYRIAVPGNIDESKEPEAEMKNGIMRISFLKSQAKEPKKINIKPG